MLKMIDDWWNDSSTLEKVCAYVIGFSLGDFINDCIMKLFNVDSFILTTIVGISTLFLTFIFFQIWRKH